MRILICEDSTLLREGLVRLLEMSGHTVVAALSDTEELPAHVAEHNPDVCILDVRLPPTWTDEGIRAAISLRETTPKLPILVLSQYVEERYAADLVSTQSTGLGYLLKDRVTNVQEFLAALEQIASGGTVLDPEVVSQLLTRNRDNEKCSDSLIGNVPYWQHFLRANRTKRLPQNCTSPPQASRSTSPRSSKN